MRPGGFVLVMSTGQPLAGHVKKRRYMIIALSRCFNREPHPANAIAAATHEIQRRF